MFSFLGLTVVSQHKDDGFVYHRLLFVQSRDSAVFDCCTHAPFQKLVPDVAKDVHNEMLINL